MGEEVSRSLGPASALIGLRTKLLRNIKQKLWSWASKMGTNRCPAGLSRTPPWKSNATYFCFFAGPPGPPISMLRNLGPTTRKNRIALRPPVNIEIEGRGETGRARELHYFSRGVGGTDI